MTSLKYAAALALFSAPAFADGHAPSGNGDIAAGEAEFNRQCVSCHVITNASGDVLAGRSGRTGPNLFNIPGATIGTVAGFRYGDSIVAAGAQGGVWTEADFVDYVQDPTGYLRAVLNDQRARGRMSYRVRDPQQAVDIYAYIASLSE